MKKLSIILLMYFVLGACNTENKEKAELNDPQLYQEKFRPQFHFSPKSNWMNDPNGMVFYENEYHLFYQYFPEGNKWGPMHWGHAVSEDLVFWDNLPIALYPDDLGYIFSGSAVVDWRNSSGFGKEDEPPLVAIYTYHNPNLEQEGSDKFQTQGIAYSNDRGRTWEKYKNNPVLDNPGFRDFRDPKVFWYDEEEKWVMILAVKNKVHLYSSKNLKSWNFESEFGEGVGGHGGVWECPDLFKLTTDNGREKWVMLVSINPGGPQGGSATQYFIGEFDGSRFSNETDSINWLDYGADNYAGVTFSDIPENDGRKIFIGWMSNWQYAQKVPTEKWRSAMTLPRTLILDSTKYGYRVNSFPIKELDTLVSGQESIVESTYSIREATYKLNIRAEGPFYLKWLNESGNELLLTVDNSHLIIDRTKAGISNFDQDFEKKHMVKLPNVDMYSLIIYVDKSSIEVFLNNGEIVLTDLIFPESPYDKLEFGGKILNNEIQYLKSIWK